MAIVERYRTILLLNRPCETSARQICYSNQLIFRRRRAGSDLIWWVGTVGTVVE